MWIVLQTVVVEDNSFNEVWAGVFTIFGAIIGVGGAILSTWLLNRHERQLDRDRERRQWRLEQLQPTLMRARQAIADFAIWDQDHFSVFHTGTQQDLEILTRRIKTDTHPLRDLGYIIVMGRFIEGDLPDTMTAFYAKYSECVRYIVHRLDLNQAARRLSLPWRSIYPPPIMLDELMDLLVDLLHETEKYAFGETDHLTIRDLEAMMAAYDMHRTEKRPQPKKD